MDIRFKNVYKSLVTKKSLAIFFVLALITTLYFLVPISVYPDSVEYYNYLNILSGKAPVYTWILTRGPSFPVLLYVFVTVFGNAMLGLLFASYLFFVGLLATIYLTLTKIINDLKFDKTKRFFIITSFVVLIVFNPVLFGYSHALLTEYVAAFFAFLSCVMAWKWIGIDFVSNKLRYILYSIFFAFMFVFIWLLKQPYFTIASFPLLIASGISIIENFKIKNIIQRLCTVIFCFACLVMGISGWRNFLISSGMNMDLVSGKDDYFLSGTIVKGISNAHLVTSDEVKISEIANDKFLPSQDKKKIAEIINNQAAGGRQRVQILNILSRSGDLVDKIVMYQDTEVFTTSDALRTWLAVATKHPFLLADSYLAGYLAAIDVYDFKTDLGTGAMTPVKQFGFYGHENYTIGLRYAFGAVNMDDFSKNYLVYPGIKQITFNPYSKVSRMNRSYGMVYSEIFTMSFLILPVVLIYSICMYLGLKKKKDNTDKGKAIRRAYQLIIIILSFTLLHIIFNVVMGAIIDRYIFVTFSGVAMSYVLLLCLDKRVCRLVSIIYTRLPKYKITIQRI